MLLDEKSEYARPASARSMSEYHRWSRGPVVAKCHERHADRQHESTTAPSRRDWRTLVALRP